MAEKQQGNHKITCEMLLERLNKYRFCIEWSPAMKNVYTLRIPSANDRAIWPATSQK